MPRRPGRRCHHPGCPELSDESYCPQHRVDTREHDKDRATAAERGYGSVWQKVRARKMTRDPLCEDCRRKGIIREAEQVHHKDGNSSNNKNNNLESLCVPCHGAKRRG